MKINLVSDLHLNWGDLELPGGEILIMAGDVFDAAYFVSEKQEDIKSRYLRFIDKELSKYTKVLYVMGNHEHYGYKLVNTLPTLNKHLPSNVHLLENETIKIDDVTFFGATFWTDFDKRNPVFMNAARRAMNDFHVIKNFSTTPYTTGKLTPEYTVDMHLNSKRALMDTFSLLNSQDKLVVITHHAPSWLSAVYRHDPLNHVYASSQEEFILDNPNIRAWVHGHMHNSSDYTIGTTRVLANPRGYFEYGDIENADFNPGFSFNV